MHFFCLDTGNSVAAMGFGPLYPIKPRRPATASFGPSGDA